MNAFVRFWHRCRCGQRALLPEERPFRKRMEAALFDYMGPACRKLTVPPTIDDSEAFREAYCQGYRHAMQDVRDYMLITGMHRPVKKEQNFGQQGRSWNE